jgi:nucleotide-binding universal stress UspA family protein
LRRARRHDSVPAVTGPPESEEPAEEQEPLPPFGDVALRRLLVATDGSASSELALEIGVKAARLDNAALTLLTVEPDVNAEAFRWSTSGAASPEALQADVRRESDRTLREAIERIPGDIPVTTIHRFGKAGPEIVEEAERGGYDAILIGARGVGRVGAMLLGSVSQYVLHNAKIHVIVARD